MRVNGHGICEGGNGMATDKQAVLAGAPGALNRPDRPWEVAVEGDSIVARWKWMDATFFSPTAATEEIRLFTFTATLTDKGTWKELDKSEKKSGGLSMGGGKVGFGGSSSTFVGKTAQKSISFTIGKDSQTGKMGVVKSSFDTAEIKKPIRDYLTGCGWKKAGLFG